jgi:DNA-binding PadR family transcriptional regulator
LAELNTTGYALLGLLNQRPWSAYELTQFMRVSHLRAVWPRAESRLYEGPKKLVQFGYATASNEKQGNRSRTIYTITEQGRQALSDWLKSGGKDVIFEHEALLKLSNADAGDIEDLRRIIASIRESTDNDLQEILAGLDILAQRSQQLSSDKRFVISTLVNHFLFEIMLARKRWLAFAEAFTREWDSLEPSEHKLAASQDHYRHLVASLRQELDE